MIYILVGLLTHFHLLAQIPTKVFTVDQVLSNYVYVFYAAFVVSFIFTPVMRATALYYGIIDRPDKLRKMHTSPVAYLGGVAVFGVEVAHGGGDLPPDVPIWRQV